MEKEHKFECPYCHMVYVRENAFLNHECKQKLRAAEIKTVTGQSAYQFYCLWMKMNQRRIPEIEVFTTSKFYNNFIEFVEYAKRINLPDIQSFIQLMVERDISPSLWMHDKVYILFIEHFDRKVGPLKQATVTINTMFKITEVAECDVSEFFEVLKPTEVLQLIRQRRLSPWILLFSEKFKIMLQNCPSEQLKFFEDLIRPLFWQMRFKKYPELVKVMKQTVAELGI